VRFVKELCLCEEDGTNLVGEVSDYGNQPINGMGILDKLRTHFGSEVITENPNSEPSTARAPTFPGLAADGIYIGCIPSACFS